MTTTADDLSEYVHANADDSAFVATCWAQADALVSGYLGSALASVPVVVYDGSVITVGAELYARRNAPSGIAQFADAQGVSPVRLTRDPMTSVYAVLSRFLPGGFA